MAESVQRLLRFFAIWRCGIVGTPDRIGHRITCPSDRRKAIATWRRAASVWMNTRFHEDRIDGWKPATRERVVRFKQR